MTIRQQSKGIIITISILFIITCYQFDKVSKFYIQESQTNSKLKVDTKAEVGPNSKERMDRKTEEKAIKSKKEIINHHNRFRQKTKIDSSSKNVYEPMKKTDTAFFFLIPKSGTSTLRFIIAKCLNLRMAVSTGMVDASDYDLSKPLHVIDKRNAGKFVNVAFGDLLGIEKAKHLRMAESGLVDIAITSQLHAGVSVFTPEHAARIMALFRHPVKRTISCYYYSRMATWERNYREEVKDMTLMEFASNENYYVNNWVTRMLSNVHGTALNDDDLKYAQNLIKEKIFVLLLDDLDESVDRMLYYMNWMNNENDAQIQKGQMVKKCIDSILSKPRNKSNYESDDKDIEEGSETWNAIESMNHYDMELYKFAKELFHGQQKQMMIDMLPTA